MNSPIIDSRPQVLAMLALAMALALPAGLRAQEWTPPEKPDPRVILREARADTRAGNFEIALAKHLWYHQHALEYTPGQSGVRLSFALSYWLELAEIYPPAMEQLKEIRDDTRQRIEERHRRRIVFDDFQEFAAINDHLGEPEATVETFRKLDEINGDAAQRVYEVAASSLVEAKEYALCGNYLAPERDFDLMATSFHLTRRHEADRPKMAHDPPPFAEPHFINDVSTLVALLVVNKRTEEADEIVLAAKKVSLEIDDKEFDAKLAEALEESLKGTVPDPWP